MRIGNVLLVIVVTMVHMVYNYQLLHVCRLHSVENVKIQHSVPLIPLTFPVFMVHAVVRLKKERLVRVLPSVPTMYHASMANVVLQF